MSIYTWWSTHWTRITDGCDSLDTNEPRDPDLPSDIWTHISRVARRVEGIEWPYFISRASLARASSLRTHTFQLQTDQSGQAVRTNDKRPHSVYICHNWSGRIGQFLNTTHQFCRTERRFIPSCLYASRINGLSAHEQSSQFGNSDVDPANQFWKMMRALL